MSMKKFDNVYVKRFGYFNVYVIKGIDGDILIDTGFIGVKKSLKRWLDQFNIKLIILTHAHVDHVWNTAYLKELYGCDVAIGKLDIENLDNTKIITTPSNNRHKKWTNLMSWGMKKFKQKPFDIDYELCDNDIIEKCGLNLKIITLPGHTTGSIGILHNNYLFCGDVIVNRKLKRIEIAYQNQDNEESKNSILKILDYEPELIFCGHDRVVKFEKFKKSLDYILEKNKQEI